MKNPTGIVLINLGTPDAPTQKAIRRYLREFLSDPRVIDINGIARWLLLNFFILPFRPKQTTKAYQQIWGEQGSPLLTYSQELTRALQSQLGENFVTALGMRYGNPSIQSALNKLQKQHCEKIIILPLFPQYSSAATGSAIEKTLSLINSWKSIPSLEVIADFYNHPLFIKAQRNVILKSLQDFSPDILLFSYHGLPVRQLQQHSARFNYRDQCFETSTKIAQTLQLDQVRYATAFQSRLGRTPWIKPYTDEVLPQLANQGIKKIAVACPSFVADCLETLEEIGIRAKEQWYSLGGEDFKLIPCLNTETTWIKALAHIISERSSAK